MDTVYGTKKYFQSLSGNADIYRSQTCRTVCNDYTYQNTLGRRSQLGAYYHMNKQPSYTNEHSITSQYGYNTWGIWRDGRNVAPSTFSAKTHAHQKNRSFSIILTTAAFIVLLAVISLAGLAFYFSSLKTSTEDPILGFEGSFRIAKGDLYSTGLKYNHTSTYKQKIDFYKRFIERALIDNGLKPLRTDVWGFGEGPLIKVSFRVFMDILKLPQNLHSVEEYIKESLFMETSATKSLYHSLYLDVESVEIKRIMDEQVVRSAAAIKEAQTVPTSQMQLEKRLIKKAGVGGAALSVPIKSASTLKPRGTGRPHNADGEPDVDVEGAPVIQGSFEGSFEITKTDADISHKKTTPTRTYQQQSHSFPSKTVTPYSLRVKPKKSAVEKLTTITSQQQQQPKTSSTTAKSMTANTLAVASTTTGSITNTTPVQSSIILSSAQSTTSTSITSMTPNSISMATATISLPNDLKSNMFTYPTLAKPTTVLPKLDVNLFTTIPILDTQPWRPIHREVSELLPGPPPAFPTKALTSANLPYTPLTTSLSDLQQNPQRRNDEIELPFINDNPVPPLPPPFDPYVHNLFSNTVRKPDFRDENVTQPQDTIFFHNFGNPVFMLGTENIERLGAGVHVQPHPLPVQLIDDVVVPPFKPLYPTLSTVDKLHFDIGTDNSKFEHLGGGVIVKRLENLTKQSPTSKVTTTENIVILTERVRTNTTSSFANPMTTEITVESTTMSSDPSLRPTDSSQIADSIGKFFMELLNLPKEDNFTSTTTELEPMESRIEPEEISPNNRTVSTEYTLQTKSTTSVKPNFMNIKEIILKRNQMSNKTETHPASANTEATLSNHNRIQPANKRPSPVTILDDSNLFPSHSKWEFVNSSSTKPNFVHAGNMRKVFNKTLQAWVSEDVEKTENLTLNDIKTKINNATNIQDISIIFDTLASKLGITPSTPTKLPPLLQNKLKLAQKDELKIKLVTTSTTTTRKPSVHSSSLETPTTKNLIQLQLQERESFIKPISSFLDDISNASSEGVGAVIPVVGEAEVEVIDPNKYEEIMQSSRFAELSSTEPTVNKLVTLLPVRSNSGIRIHRPLISDVDTEKRSLNSNGKRKISSSSIIGQRKFGRPPAEAVVKGGLKVIVK